MRVRKGFVDSFPESVAYGPYDEFPMLSPETDPQIHVSKNSRPQPFYLICSKDSLLAQLSGTSTVRLKHHEVISQSTAPGDFLYIPAGTPHKIEPHQAGIMHRYKAREAGLEGVAWYCGNCEKEVYREVWDSAVELPQYAYARITRTFNDTPSLRVCKSCGTEHAPADLTGIRWEEVGADILATMPG